MSDLALTGKFFDAEYGLEESLPDSPSGCVCKDSTGDCFMNYHPAGKAKEGNFALCEKIPSSITSWVYPDAAMLDIDGRSGNTSFRPIGVGLCLDMVKNNYPVKHSTEVASPKACRNFCLSVGYTEGLVGFQWSSSEKSCNCSIDALVYGSGSGTGRMGNPDGQAGSSCFERRYAIIGEDVSDDERYVVDNYFGSVTSTGHDNDRASGSVTSTGNSLRMPKKNT
mmetsp:Transcript_3546/g.4088  ORF Transcript_3546/g.4088 Transcript_3546/m.4088 type:complete len:224 (+) Transcript_3546:3-674(+)